MRISKVILYLLIMIFSVNMAVTSGCIRINETDTVSNYKTQKNLLEKLEFYDEISDTELMAHCSMASYDNYINDGTVWIVYYGNYISKREYRENKDTSIFIIKYNLITKEKIKVKILSYNDRNNNYIETQTPYDPNLLVEDESILVYYTSYGEKGESIRYLRIEKTTLKIVDANYITLKINNTYVNLTVENLTKINYGYDVGGLGYLVFSSNFRFYGNKIYGCICSFETDNYNGLIVSSVNGIEWDIEFIPNFELNGCNEADFIFLDNYFYFVVRTFSNVTLVVYNIETLEFSKEIISSHCSKPLLNCYASKIYCTVNIENYSSKYISESYRNQICVYQLDNYEILTKLNLFFEYGVSYFSTFWVQDSFYFLFTTDIDKSDITQNKKDIVLFKLKNIL